jgi:hypothetical protein
MTAPEGGAEADRKGARMSIRPPSPPRRAVAALALAFLVLAAACTPGGSDDNKSSSSGPVTFKLQANAVKGGKNATETSWIQDWVIPNYLVWNWLGLTNTQVPLWAHNLFGSAFYIFLLRQFLLGQRYFVEGIATAGRKG